MRNIKILKVIFVLSLVGIALATYSLNDHFGPLDGSGICNISETINCDIVNKGPYSEEFGVPVALIGILFYSVLAWFSYSMAFRNDGNSKLEKLFLCMSGFGVVYSLSLGSFVFYMLDAICPMCVASYMTIIAIFILSFKIRKK